MCTAGEPFRVYPPYYFRVVRGEAGRATSVNRQRIPRRRPRHLDAMDSQDSHLDRDDASAKRPYRPPIGIPTPGEPRVPATVAAVLLHVLIALLVLAPTLIVSARLVDIGPQGAGGAGPAGGGGGGSRGTGGVDSLVYVPERLDYVVVSPPVPKAEPKPEEKKPEEIKPVPPPPP